jgi:ActR/RegA family two-component response regulator
LCVVRLLAYSQTVHTLDSMLALLVADDPRRSADRVLARLVQIHKAQGGAILVPRGPQAEIWLSVGLSLSASADLPAVWALHHEALSSGRAVIEPGFALLPARLGHEMVAALYLDRPANVTASEARLFGTAIAQAVLAGNAPRPAPEVNPTDEARAQLLSLLERHEWNIAEVARLLKVTRRTVYMRLRSFGIRRKRVPKIYKKIPVDA